MLLPHDQYEAGWHVARKKVLVVDNKIDGAESLALLLQLKGCEVRIAHDGFEAVRVAAAFEPDVVFIEIAMPLLDGFDTTRYLREIDCCKNSYIVALTAFGEESHRAYARAAGMNDLLVKPANPKDVYRVIQASSLSRPSGNESPNEARG